MSRKKIRVAIVGVGNCASALIQGLEYYKDVKETSSNILGLIHPSVGGYLLKDIKIVAAFDVNAKKIGKDIAEAIHVFPNNAQRFANVPKKGVRVSPGFPGDGIAPHMHEIIPVTNEHEAVRDVLKSSGAEILVSFLPVGSYEAARFYAQACIDSRVAFINGMPEFIASEPEWADKFAAAGIPCAGDDVMSQVGATIVNKVLLELTKDRGQEARRSWQLNHGGNADFNNMTDLDRVHTKRISKAAPLQYDTDCIVSASPGQYKPELGDRKTAHISMEGVQFGGIRYAFALRLDVDDSPNSAGVIVDAIRLMKLSLDRGLSGYQDWSAYYFKHPMRHMRIEDARRLVEEFIGGLIVLSEKKIEEAVS